MGGRGVNQCWVWVSSGFPEFLLPCTTPIPPFLTPTPNIDMTTPESEVKMVQDYSYKIFVEGKHKHLLDKMGLTQVEEWTPEHSAFYWSIPVKDMLNKYIEAGQSHDTAMLNLKKCEKGRETCDELINTVFSKPVYVYGSRANKKDRTLRDTGQNDFWNALDSIIRMVEDSEIDYIGFGNDNYEGWQLIQLRILNENRPDITKIKDLVDKATSFGGVF